MLSVLFLSADQTFSHEFQAFFEANEKLKNNTRIKHVLSTNDALKWLSMHSYDVVLFDHSLEQKHIVDFLLESWALVKPPISAYFSRMSPSKEVRGLFTLGVEDCSGVQCFERYVGLIDKIPKVLSALNATHTKVMIVEDLDSPRDIICALIQSLGFKDVVGMTSVDEGLNALLKAPFDYFCVICDINMPHKNGFEFVSEVRGRLSLSYLPVVMLTSDPSETNLLNALKVGVTGFLAKPPKKNLLKAEISKARRIVALGKDPQMGTPEEIRLLEKALRDKNK